MKSINEIINKEKYLNNRRYNQSKSIKILFLIVMRFLKRINPKMAKKNFCNVIINLSKFEYIPIKSDDTFDNKYFACGKCAYSPLGKSPKYMQAKANINVENIINLQVSNDLGSIFL